MQVNITTDEMVAAFGRDWPKEAEITMLRLANSKLAAQIEPAHPLHSHPHNDERGLAESGQGAT